MNVTLSFSSCSLRENWGPRSNSLSDSNLDSSSATDSENTLPGSQYDHVRFYLGPVLEKQTCLRKSLNFRTALDFDLALNDHVAGT